MGERESSLTVSLADLLSLSSSKEKNIVDSLFQLINLLSEEECELLLAKIAGKKEGVPVSIFKGDLSGLEALVIYLTDVKKKPVKEIAFLLKRNVNTIYTTIRLARRKKAQLDLSGSLKVPLEIFSQRKFSLLESLVAFLRKEKKLVEIAQLLGKSNSTIKTVSRRYKLKHGR